VTRFGFGGISCQRMPGDRRTDAQLYAEALELLTAAVAQGRNREGAPVIGERRSHDCGHRLLEIVVPIRLRHMMLA